MLIKQGSIGPGCDKSPALLSIAPLITSIREDEDWGTESKSIKLPNWQLH